MLARGSPFTSLWQPGAGGDLPAVRWIGWIMRAIFRASERIHHGVTLACAKPMPRTSMKRAGSGHGVERSREAFGLDRLPFGQVAGSLPLLPSDRVSVDLWGV